MNNKRGQFLVRDWVMSAVLFSGIIALFVVVFASFADTYDRNDLIDDGFSETFDTFQEDTAVIEEMWEQTSGEGGLSTVGTFDILFKSTFGVISLVFSSVKTYGIQVFSFVEFFGIPSEVGFLIGSLLMALLSVVIIFIVISSVSRRDL